MKKSITQIIIESLSKKRYEYIHQREESYDLDKDEYSYDPPEVDELGDQIMDLIKKGRNDLSFEFIFEEFTKLGQAPCLLYDDNGHFAISGDGFCSISLEPEDWEGTHFVKKEEWKDSIREALNYYLDEDDD